VASATSARSSQALLCTKPPFIGHRDVGHLRIGHLCIGHLHNKASPRWPLPVISVFLLLSLFMLSILVETS
jgi:hypothetical protein